MLPLIADGAQFVIEVEPQIIWMLPVSFWRLCSSESSATGLKNPVQETSELNEI